MLISHFAFSRAIQSSMLVHLLSITAMFQHVQESFKQTRAKRKNLTDRIQVCELKNSLIPHHSVHNEDLCYCHFNVRPDWYCQAKAGVIHFVHHFRERTDCILGGAST